MYYIFYAENKQVMEATIEIPSKKSIRKAGEILKNPDSKDNEFKSAWI